MGRKYRLLEEQFDDLVDKFDKLTENYENLKTSFEEQVCQDVTEYRIPWGTMPTLRGKVEAVVRFLDLKFLVKAQEPQEVIATKKQKGKK